MSASLGLARWHMQNMQTFEFLHLLGHSSGSAVSWDVFRGGCHRTAISGILPWRGVLLSGWGVGVVCLFCLPACFQVPARSAILIYSICYRTFLKALQNFVSLGGCWTLHSFEKHATEKTTSKIHAFKHI